MSNVNSACSCNSGSCQVVDQLTSCCSASIGFSALPGGMTILTYVVPYAGSYVITAATTSGNPPSNFNVYLNGSQVGSIKGQGGSIQVNASPGDVINVQVTWGVFYMGGTVKVCVTAPSPPSPSPTPIPSPVPGQQSNLTKMLILTLFIIAIVGIIVGLIIKYWR